jgi:transcription termination factor NusB
MNYGKIEKKVIFEDTDKRHADLKIRLYNDGLKQGEFFRAIVSGYLEKDEDLLKFLEKYKSQSKTRMEKVNKMLREGNKTKKIFSLDPEEIENIFDIIAEENKDL